MRLTTRRLSLTLHPRHRSVHDPPASDPPASARARVPIVRVRVPGKGCSQCRGGGGGAPSAPSGPSGGGGSLGTGYTRAHNVKRQLHCNTPTARRDATLERQAQAYANTCPTGHASRSQRANAGENLYWAGGSGVGTAAQEYEKAARAWYDEIKDYNFATGNRKPGGGMIGHFTQMVWKTSVKIGCGVKTSCTNKFGRGMRNSAVVCRYAPAGNFIGRYPQNVARTKASGGCGREAEAEEAMLHAMAMNVTETEEEEPEEPEEAMLHAMNVPETEEEEEEAPADDEEGATGEDAAEEGAAEEENEEEEEGDGDEEEAEAELQVDADADADANAAKEEAESEADAEARVDGEGDHADLNDGEEEEEEAMEAVSDDPPEISEDAMQEAYEAIHADLNSDSAAAHEARLQSAGEAAQHVIMP